jgi:hypothetical protein
MLFLDRVEGFIVVNMDLSVEVVVGNNGDGSSSVGGSSGLRRHDWGGRNENNFPKDRRSKFCFYVQGSKKNKEK